MVLGRGVEGNEIVRKGEWAGIQEKGPRAKVLLQTRSIHGTKIESLAGSPNEASTQRGEAESK